MSTSLRQRGHGLGRGQVDALRFVTLTLVAGTRVQREEVVRVPDRQQHLTEVFNKYGSDAMRWFLMSSPVVRGGNLIVKEESIRDTVRQVLLPIWNTYYFFTLYAGACNKGEDRSRRFAS